MAAEVEYFEKKRIEEKIWKETEQSFVGVTSCCEITGLPPFVCVTQACKISLEHFEMIPNRAR